MDIRRLIAMDSGGGLGLGFGGEGGFPFTDLFGRADGAVANGWTIPGTAAISGGKLVITPTLGTEMLTNPGFEGTYSGGVAPNWTKKGTPTVAESADVHGGTKAQSIISASSSNGIDSNSLTAIAATYFIMSMWVKLTAGSGNVAIDMSGAFGGGTFIYVPTASYSKITFGFRGASGGSGSHTIRSTGGATILFDDASHKPMTYATGGIYRLARTGTSYRVLVDPETIATGVPFGVFALVDNPAAPLYTLSAIHDGISTLKLVQRLNGTPTDLITQSIAYDATKKVEITRSGADFELKYGGTKYGATQTIADATLLASQYVGVVSMDGGNSIASFECLPLA